MSKRQGIMLCYPFEEERLKKWSPPYLVQPKPDGERCRAIGIYGEWLLLSSEVNIFNSVPHINKALKDQDLDPNMELDGELYTHGHDFSDIHSVVSRTVNLHEDHERVGYYIFDVVANNPQHDRTKYLMSLHLKPPLYLIPTMACVDLDDVMRAYDLYLDRGYEGIVVRHVDNMYIRRRSTFMMKFKPKKSDIYRIIDITEAITKDGIPKNMVGSFYLIDDMGTKFKAAPGIGWTDEKKIELWKNPEKGINHWCKIVYQNITPGRGVPRFGRFTDILEKCVDDPEVKDYNPLI